MKTKRFPNPSRRGLAVVMGFLALSMGVLTAGIGSAGASTAKKAPPVVTVNMVGGNTVTTLVQQIAAFDKSVCRPYGININLTEGGVAPDEAGLANGQIQFSNHGAVVAGIADGVVKGGVVLAYQGYDEPLNFGGIFAPASTTKASQLSGKTLAGLTGGGVPNRITALLMSGVGLTPSQYNLVNFSSVSAFYGASAAGETAATWATLPLVSSLQQLKWHNLVPLSQKVAYTQDNWLTGNGSYVKAHPTVTENFLRCYAAATKVARNTSSASRQQAAAAVASFDQVSVASVLTALRPYGLAQAVTPVNATELSIATNFLNGSPVAISKIKAMISNKYINATGINLPVLNKFGPTQ